MCDKVVRNKQCMLLFVPDHFWTQQMCNERMHTMPNAFHRILDRFKTQEMCIKAVEVDPSFLQLVPGHFKTQEIYDKALINDSSSLQFVPDWFVTQQQIHIWYDDYYDDDGGHWDNDDDEEDKFFEWYDGYKKRKAQKAKIKRELLPITWYPSRCWDWCVSEDEKKETEQL